MDTILSVKQRFGIIGDNPKLNRALEKSIKVANSDISVLVTGESGVGKENIPKIIHQYSHRKHSKYIAVNCGAIPDGTIDSELFGHEKGAFTGATANRSGYFEVADGGTIFLDEVGELPLATQVRLLRVLESGEFIDHQNGYYSHYYHNQENFVKKNEKIDKGMLIAKLGNTGVSTGPHLHFEIWKDGVPIDPLTFFPDFSKKSDKFEEEANE